MKKLIDFLVIVLGCAVFCLILYLMLLDKKFKPTTFKQFKLEYFLNLNK